MKQIILKIEDLRAKIGEKKVLRGGGFEIGQGEVHALTGANGSGKTTLAMVLLGDSQFAVDNSSRGRFDGQDLLTMDIDERARAGLFVAWQSPVTIPGVSVFSLCKASYEARGNKIEKLTEFRKKLGKLAVVVGLLPEHIGRSVNEGFSGGEKKRLELLQLLLLKPKLAILDEIDSGLDEEGRRLVGTVVQKMRREGTAFLVISHYDNLLEVIGADKVWEMRNGRLSARS